MKLATILDVQFWINKIHSILLKTIEAKSWSNLRELPKTDVDLNSNEDASH